MGGLISKWSEKEVSVRGDPSCMRGLSQVPASLLRLSFTARGCDKEPEEHMECPLGPCQEMRDAAHMAEDTDAPEWADELAGNT